MQYKRKIIRVEKGDLSVINDILTYHLDSADKRTQLPPASHLEKLMEDDRTYLFAAICDGVVAGYTLAYRFPSLYAAEYLAYLYDIEVAVAHRRNGLGHLLVKTLLGCLKSDGVKEVWLGTAIDNMEGQALFHATGAVKSGETFHDYTYYLT